MSIVSSTACSIVITLFPTITVLFSYYTSPCSTKSAPTSCSPVVGLAKSEEPSSSIAGLRPAIEMGGIANRSPQICPVVALGKAPLWWPIKFFKFVGRPINRRFLSPLPGGRRKQVNRESKLNRVAISEPRILYENTIFYQVAFLHCDIPFQNDGH
jgi:hypothetical protein